MTKVICTKCDIEKAPEEYSFRNKSKGIRHKHCKKCVKIVRTKHYKLNKQEYVDRAVRWNKHNKSRRNAIAKERFAEYRGYKPCKCCERRDIQDFYEKCPPGHHVDHIITLTLGGKHCLQNLQYLTASEHGTKSCNERWNNV